MNRTESHHMVRLLQYEGFLNPGTRTISTGKNKTESLKSLAQQLFEKEAIISGEPTYELAQIVLDNARRLAHISEKLGHITRYASKDYVAGKRILDLDEASKEKQEP